MEFFNIEMQDLTAGAYEKYVRLSNKAAKARANGNEKRATRLEERAEKAFNKTNTPIY